MAERVTFNRSRFAEKEKMTLNKLNEIIEDFKKGTPANTTIGNFQIGYSKYHRIINWYLAEQNEKPPIIDIEKRYYKNEDEMIIQDYKAEDLTGQELEILNGLR